MELSQNQIHIWNIDLRNNDIDAENLYNEILSPLEKERADRLKSKQDQQRAIISRGLLRKKLGAYLQKSPKEISFSYNKHGKPFLNSTDLPMNIKFNVTHSNDLLLYAITLDREIGIDVEFIKHINKADKIVERFFSEEENSFYHSHSEDKKKWAFFTLWTRKEAYSKARGRGIGLPAKDFDLKLIPEEKERPDAKEFTKIQSKWTLFNIEISSEYLAALATEGKDIEICRFNFEN